MSKRIALLIGTKNYEDSAFAKLTAPNVDISALAAVLTAPDICAFDRVETMLDASYWDAQLAVSRFFSDGTRNDLLLLYFSGHGVVDEFGKLFLCLRNTRRDVLRATSLRASSVRDEMDACYSQRQVLVLDCCHAGAFLRDAKGSAVGESVGTMTAFEGNGRGRVVLTATDATQFAFEGDEVVGAGQSASLFTHFIVEGMKTGLADVDGNGHVTVDEIFNYAYQRVTQVKTSQTPGKWSYKQHGDIIIARNPKPVPLRQLIEPGLLEAAAFGNPRAVREASVRALAEYLRDPRPGVVLAAREALTGLMEDDSRGIAALARHAMESSNSNGPLPATSVQPIVLPTPVPLSVIGKPAAVPSTGSYARWASIAVLVGVAFFGFSAWVGAPAPASDSVPTPSAVVPPVPMPNPPTPKPQPSPAASPIKAKRLRELVIERSADLEGSRVFVIQGESKRTVEDFPAKLEVVADEPITVEAYFGSKRLIQKVSFNAGETVHTIQIRSDSPWKMTSPTAAQPDPQVRTRLAEAGSMDDAQQLAGRSVLKSAFKRCASGAAAGQTAMLRIQVSSEGVVTSVDIVSTTLPSAVASCFSAAARTARFPGARSSSVAIEVSVVMIAPAGG